MMTQANIDQLHADGAMSSVNPMELDALGMADTVAMLSCIKCSYAVCTDKAQALIMQSAIRLLVMHKHTLINNVFTALSI